jgi:hypothetical protein
VRGEGQIQHTKDMPEMQGGAQERRAHDNLRQPEAQTEAGVMRNYKSQNTNYKQITNSKLQTRFWNL